MGEYRRINGEYSSLIFNKIYAKLNSVWGNFLGMFGILQMPSQDWSGQRTFILPEGEMTKSAFVRRQNDDSTTDSICLGCFQTLASSQEQADLAAAESSHACNPIDVDDLQWFESRSRREIIA